MDPGIHCCLYPIQLAKLLAVQSLKWVFIPSTFVYLTQMPKSDFWSFRIVKREKEKLPHWAISTWGAEARFGRASLSQLPAAVTPAPRQGWIPQMRRHKYCPRHMAAGVGDARRSGCLVHIFLWGWELKDHSKHKAIWNWCLLQPKLTKMLKALFGHNSIMNIHWSALSQNQSVLPRSCMQISSKIS